VGYPEGDAMRMKRIRQGFLRSMSACLNSDSEINMFPSFIENLRV